MIRLPLWFVLAAAVVAGSIVPVALSAQPCPEIATACVEAESAQLKLFKKKNRAPKLKWKASVLDIAIEALEDPVNVSPYSFCVYAGTAERLIMAVDVAPGAGWKRGTKKYQYKDKSGSRQGLRGIKVSSGSMSDAKLMVTAKGDELMGLGFPFADVDFPVMVQMANYDKGICWESTFEKENFAKNEVNRRGALRTSAIFKPQRCREDGGCAVERPLVGAALCRDRVAAGGGMAKRMKIKMGDITRCRGREANGKTDGGCDPGVCPPEDPACALLDSNLRSGVVRAIGHYQTKLDLACDDISVAAVQESNPGWGAPCENARTVAELMSCLETGVWSEHGNTLGDAVFGDSGTIEADLIRCRKEIAKHTQKYSSKFNTILYSCRRSPIVRGRSCNEDPVVTAQGIFDGYVAKVRNACLDSMIERLSFGPPCEGARTIDELTVCLAQLARDLGFQGMAVSYP